MNNNESNEDNNINDEQHFVMPEPDEFESGIPYEQHTARVNHSASDVDIDRHNKQAEQNNFVDGFSRKMNNGVRKNIMSNSGILSGISIKAKLMGSLSILTLIILLMGTLSYTTIVKINGVSNSIANEYAVLARLSESMKTTVYKIRDAEKDYLLMGEEEALTRSSRYLASFSAQLKEATVLGKNIAEKYNHNMSSEFNDIFNNIEHYQLRFAKQVKEIKQVRLDTEKEASRIDTFKKEINNKIDTVNEHIRTLLDDFWVNSKQDSKLVGQAAEDGSFSSRVELDFGASVIEFDRSIKLAQLNIASYLQLHQTIYVDEALSALRNALNVAESIRKISKHEQTRLDMKRLAAEIDSLSRFLQSGVKTENAMAARIALAEQTIHEHKNELKHTGDSILSQAEKIATSAWVSIKQQARDLHQSGLDMQFRIAIMVIFGTVMGVLVLVFVPRPIINSINELLIGAQRVAAGDLSRPIQSNGKDELATLSHTFNNMRLNLMNLVERIQRATVQISTTVNEISAAANQQSSTANEQTASVSQFTSTLTQMSQTANELAQTATIISDATTDVSSFVSTNSASSNQTLDSMNNIGDSTRQTSDRIKALNDQMDGINEAVVSIASIADQTTLLSLNAAIEANKAGEMGKGFSVVATEIRRLSDRSNDSAVNVSQMVRDIQRATESSVVAMDKSAEEIKNGVHLVRETTDTLLRVSDRIETIRQQTKDIATGASEQARGTNEVNSTMNQLLASAEVSAEAARQTSEATQDLSSMAAQLSNAVSEFKIA